MLIYVGNNPVTEEMVDHFNKLLELLLDVCMTISLWVYIKNLTDDASYRAEMQSLALKHAIYSGSFAKGWVATV